MRTAVWVANTGWYAANFLLPLAAELRRHRWEVIFAAPEDAYTERCRREGFEVVALPMSRQCGVVRDLVAVVGLASCLHRARPQVLHAFTMKGLLVGVLAHSLSTGRQSLVLNVSGRGYLFDHQDVKARVGRTIMVAILRTARRRYKPSFVFQNYEDCNFFREAGLVDENRAIVVGGSGVVVPEASAGRWKPGPGCAPTVLFAGRLLRDKGVADFVRLAVMMNREGIGVRFLVAGATDPGSPLSHTHEEIEEWSTSTPVEFLGKHERMADLYRRAWVVVVPTRYGEGLPRTILEAGSWGVPCVAYRNRGTECVIEHGATGLLVDPGDVDGLRRCVKQLLHDSQVAVQMGAAAKIRIKARFSTERVAGDLAKLYADIVGGEGGARDAGVVSQR